MGYHLTPDINSIGPLVKDPNNLSPTSLRRNRFLLDMLIDCGDLVRAWKIIAAYRQLRPEYTGKIQARAKRIARHGVKAKSTPPPEKPPPARQAPKKPYV